LPKGHERALAASEPGFQPLVRAALANAYLARGDVVRAKALFKEADAEASAGVKPLIQRGLGQIALAEGRPDEAAALFDLAATSAGGDDAAYHRLWAYEGLARARLAAGNRAGATDAYRQAMTTAEQVRARFRSEEFKTGFFGDVQRIFDGAITALVAEGQDESAFAASERSRARALQDLVRGRVTAMAGAQAIGGSPVSAASASDVASALPDGLALIEYHVTDKQTFVWIIRRGGVSMVTVSAGRDQLGDEIRRFREAIRGRSAGVGPLAEALYGRLVQPLGLNESEAVVIVPHGSLHYVPFQALRGPRGYLVEERAVSYAPSASVLRYLAGGERSRRETVLALGNPDIGTPQLALPGTEREVQALQALFPEAEVYLHKEASKERLLARAGVSELVHVGAHAELDEIDPLYSMIRLASTEKQRGDLEAHEVYRMRLSKTALVTLSACDTGLGKIARGDEMWGFTRSFLAAGTRALMVSLWPVEDVSTSLLMGKFYEQLRNENAQRALRSAQLDVLRNGQYRHPFFWASFNLVGDWR